MRLLLVEDDPVLGDGVQAALTGQGYAVDWTVDGRQAQIALEAVAYAAVVLDLRLPKISGLDVLRGLRARGDKTPVLILTARDTVADRVAGLDSGADDYLVKPFDLDELFARLRSLLRRHNRQGQNTLECGEVVMTPDSFTVTRTGQAVKLSRREFSILQLLLENQGRVMSRTALEEALYGWNEEVESNAIEVHVHKLRKKLGTSLIKNIRGVGYLIRDGRE